MKFLQNLNNVKVNEVGQFLVSNGTKFDVIRARLVSDTDIEKVQVISKPIIDTVKMLPTMSCPNITTLSLEETKQVIEFVRTHGCKKGTECHIDTTCSSGARYSMEEALALGEGIGFTKNKKGERVPCVMPKEERVKRGLERTIHAVMVFDGNSEKDLYDNTKYHSEGVIDSLAK